MGDSSDDAAATGLAPTELGDAIDETEGHTAWSLDDGDEWLPPRRLTPARITALAVATSLAVVGAAAALVVTHLKQPTLGQVSMVTPSRPAPTTKIAPVGPSGFEIPPPPPPPTVTVTQPPPPVQPRLESQSAYGQITPEALAALDRQFVANMRAQGWAVWDPTLMAQRGHQVCALLSRGSSPQFVARQIAADSGMEPDMALRLGQSFTSIAMSTYPDCP